MPTTYAIPNGRTAMDATLWTGNGAARTLNNSDNATTGFKPDLVWVKDRTTAGIWNVLFDSNRGAGYQLSSNQTDAELAPGSSVAGYVSAFNTNGFNVVGGSSSYYSVNQTNDNYVGWQWVAGQGVNNTNTNGSITSTVSANTTTGFSIVTYTGTGANASIGHGLSTAPQFIIAKTRTAVSSWPVYSSSLGSSNYLTLDTTSAVATNNVVWQGVNPTSSVFYVGTAGGTNQSGVNYVAYCWAPVAGFSQFGSYTGNGSADGPFIYLGFRPKWILIKSSSGVRAWQLEDSTRNSYNPTGLDLRPNVSDAETNDSPVMDFLSNGFKQRNTYGDFNNSGETYIYAAFAENPFKYANAR